jgi:ubiquinone/menaquinone biosynthesis C-methylase UbiE
MQEANPPLPEAWRLLQGFRGFQIIVAACELGIPDLVGDGPRTASELAAATGTQEGALRRFLHGLVAWGVLTEDAGDRFTATSISETFRADRPGLRNLALMLDHEAYRTWQELTFSLRTGEPAFERVYGKPRWEALQDDPDGAAKFNAAMVENTKRVANAFAQSFDFAKVATVVDVGGGNGALLAAVLQANPDTRGILFDLPTGLIGAKERMDEAGLGDRVSLVEGDFFASVPSGADLYMLKWIIHDWNDKEATAILTTCRAAMQPSARLVLIERTLPDRIDASPRSLEVTMADLNMMVVLGGRERTQQEYERLMEEAGLRMVAARPLAGGNYSTYEAIRA